MKPVDIKQDYKSWISHSLYFLAVQVSFGLLGVLVGIDTLTAFYIGFMAASLALYIREVSHETWQWEFWRWKKWDSILDIVVPMAAGYVFMALIKYLLLLL